MRNILPLIIFVVFISCTKEKEAISEQKISDNVVSTVDSIQIPTIENPYQSSAFIIIPQDISPEKGRAVFSQNGKTLFYFDQNSNKGLIRIDGKDYLLDRFDFNENNYAVFGSGVVIEATNGDFKSGTGDCVSGEFPEVKVTVNGKALNLANITVQDCPNY